MEPSYRQFMALWSPLERISEFFRYKMGEERIHQHSAVTDRVHFTFRGKALATNFATKTTLRVSKVIFVTKKISEKKKKLNSISRISRRNSH